MCTKNGHICTNSVHFCTKSIQACPNIVHSLPLNLLYFTCCRRNIVRISDNRRFRCEVSVYVTENEAVNGAYICSFFQTMDYIVHC